jgi:hypothetical protein
VWNYASSPSIYLLGLHSGNFAFFNTAFIDFTFTLYVQLYVQCLHPGACNAHVSCIYILDPYLVDVTVMAYFCFT